MIKISYVIHKSKIDNKGHVPIYMRLTLNGKRSEISTKTKIPISNWVRDSQSVNKVYKNSVSINNLLLLNKSDALKNYNMLLTSGKDFDVVDLRNKILGISNSKSILDAFEFHNKNMKSLLDIEYALGTYKRYLITKNILRDFIKFEYNKNDIALSSVDVSFLECFLHYLKTNKKHQITTATKYVKNVKKVLKVAAKHNWIDQVPDIKLGLKGYKKVIKYLTAEELHRIESTHISLDRLSKVRDIFVFCCYTGLAYSDIEKLTTGDICTNISGTRAIEVYRTKTKTRCYIPLLPQAEAILKKYTSCSDRIILNKLLPVRSNQSINSYLKELAVICKINKNLTHHHARFTFATTVTLANDIPITDVAYMMGHKNLITTQIYASVVDKNVNNSMAILGEKIGNKDQSKIKKKHQ